MPTVIFDFDSTLISGESLELILAKQLQDRPEVMQQIEDLTQQGMAGEMSFEESLEKRLQLAAPTRVELEDFGKAAIKLLTPGMTEFIQDLRQHAIDIWIISGGLREAILPVADFLNIPANQVCSASLIFDANGEFQQLDPTNSFNHSKVKGAQAYAAQWQSPSIIVGDGMTDYALYEANLATHFIAFTQHQNRPAVCRVAPHTADSINELNTELQILLTD